MKKLIFALTTIFALSSFADSCPAGDLGCENVSANSGAGVIATGISCETCAAYEKAEGALLSNQKGSLITRGTSKPTKSAPSNSSVKDAN